LNYLNSVCVYNKFVLTIYLLHLSISCCRLMYRKCWCLLCHVYCWQCLLTYPFKISETFCSRNQSR